MLLAPEKAGKSTTVNQWQYDLMQQEVITTGGYLEDTDVKAAQRFAALHSGVMLKDFRDNLREGRPVDEELCEEAFELMKDSFFFSTKSKGIDIHDLPNMIEYSAKKGSEFVVVDHISKIISASDNLAEGERRACLLYTSPSPRDRQKSRMPSSA